MYPENDSEHDLQGDFDKTEYDKNKYTSDGVSNGHKHLYDPDYNININNSSTETVETVENVKMERSLGLISGTAIIAGTMIGSGIFVSPKGVLEGAGSVGMSLIVWLVCGIMAMLGALTYAELGTTIPKSGGEHAYLMEAFNENKKRKCFGPIPAFLFDWICIFIIRPSMFAIMCFTLGTYITQPFYADCAPPEYLTKLFTVLAMLLLCAINCMSIHLAEKIQVSMTVIKLFAAVIIMFGGFYSIGKGTT